VVVDAALENPDDAGQWVRAHADRRLGPAPE
jgi:hypothetical protein